MLLCMLLLEAASWCICMLSSLLITIWPLHKLPAQCKLIDQLLLVQVLHAEIAAHDLLGDGQLVGVAPYRNNQIGILSSREALSYVRISSLAEQNFASLEAASSSSSSQILHVVSCRLDRVCVYVPKYQHWLDLVKAIVHHASISRIMLCLTSAS